MGPSSECCTWHQRVATVQSAGRRDPAACSSSSPAMKVWARLKEKSRAIAWAASGPAFSKVKF